MESDVRETDVRCGVGSGGHDFVAFVRSTQVDSLHVEACRGEIVAVRDPSHLGSCVMKVDDGGFAVRDPARPDNVVMNDDFRHLCGTVLTCDVSSPLRSHVGRNPLVVPYVRGFQLINPCYTL